MQTYFKWVFGGTKYQGANLYTYQTFFPFNGYLLFKINTCLSKSLHFLRSWYETILVWKNTVIDTCINVRAVAI